MGIRTPRPTCHARRLRRARLRPWQPPDYPRHLHARPPSGQDGEGLQARQRRGVADKNHYPAFQWERTNHCGNRCRAWGWANLPLSLPLHGMQNPVCAPVDQLAHRQGYPWGVAQPRRRRQVWQPIPRRQSAERIRLARGHQRHAGTFYRRRTRHVLGRTGADPHIGDGVWTLLGEPPFHARSLLAAPYRNGRLRWWGRETLFLREMEGERAGYGAI